MNNKIIFIRGDLNTLQEGIMPLNNQVWIKILKDFYGDLDGKKIWLYEKTSQNIDRSNLLIFPGLVSIKNNDFFVKISEQDVKPLEKYPEFDEWEIKDVIQDPLFNLTYRILFNEKNI